MNKIDRITLWTLNRFDQYRGWDQDSINMTKGLVCGGAIIALCAYLALTNY